MPLYRVRKAGYFMGTFFNKGVELELLDKQAKYALMSGQLEEVNPAPKSLKKKVSDGTQKGPYFGVRGPKPAPKRTRDAQGETSGRGSVGGTFGGGFKR